MSTIPGTDFDYKLSPTAVIIINPNHYHERVSIELRVGDDHTIHGNHLLPDGYRWIIPHPFTCFTLVEGLKGRSKTKISRSHSLLKMAISVFQLVLSSFTIYRTRGPQIERYGFASFGLSTIPYAFMSLLNLICVGCTGQYPYLFMLHTRTLEEARGRIGAEISGAVGILANDISQNLSGQGGTRARDGVAFASLWTENGGTLLCAKMGDSTQRFKLVDDPKGATFIFDVHSLESRLRIYEPKHQPGPKTRLLKRPAPKGLRSQLKIFIAHVSPFLAGILPYAIISFLTTYQTQQSTTFQRVVMMTWLGIGQVPITISALFFSISPNFFIRSPCWDFFQKQIPNQNPNPPESCPSTQTRTPWWEVIIRVGYGVIMLVFLLVILGAVVVPPIAGFVVVGKMLHEFDTCS